MENTDSQEAAGLQWQPVDNEDKAFALHSDVLNFQTLGRNITFITKHSWDWKGLSFSKDLYVGHVAKHRKDDKTSNEAGERVDWTEIIIHLYLPSFYFFQDSFQRVDGTEIIILLYLPSFSILYLYLVFCICIFNVSTFVAFCTLWWGRPCNSCCWTCCNWKTFCL